MLPNLKKRHNIEGSSLIVRLKLEGGLTVGRHNIDSEGSSLIQVVRLQLEDGLIVGRHNIEGS